MLATLITSGYKVLAIHLYNTLTRKKEEFIPLNDKKAGLYTCGPTVYDYAHIGNLRSFIFADILQRALKYNNFSVNWVMNITDLDDKTIRDSKIKYPEMEPGDALSKFTQEYEKIFWDDLEKLNIEKPDEIPHATDFIPQMQELIVKIMDAGYGYEKDGSFYFNVIKYAKDFKYGNLVNLDLTKLKTSERIQADEYKKEEIQDFALWKAAKENEPSWDFEFEKKNYPGRPGWHIECSAMSHEYLKTPFDIHTGGIDLKFPHHENEIAQSITGYGAEKLANFFIHNDFVLVDGEKMAKRLKNFYTLENLREKEFSPLAFRYLCLNAHYRSKLNFTWQGLEASQNALNNLYREYEKIISGASGSLASIMEAKLPEKTQNYHQQFINAINDDLNTPQALAIMWETVKDKNLPNAEKKNLLLEFDKIFGLGLSEIKQLKIPDNIKELAQQREQARQEKNWQEADKIRKEIEVLGYEIKDTETGPKIL
jgi:cysteinyl-tRNA synthetase